MFAFKPTMIAFVLSSFLLVDVALVDIANAETVLLLKNGERLSGQWLNPNESPRRKYSIKTSSGTVITLERKLVHRRLKEKELQYEKITQTFPDTAEGQMKLADWCNVHKLQAQRKKHLHRVIELDPNQKDARQLLGYQLRNGVWMTKAEWYASQGLKKHKGAYISQQEIELINQRRKSELAQKEWFKKIKKWQRDLSKSDRAKRQTAEEKLIAINDPYAVPAIIKFLDDEKKMSRKYLYIDILGQVGNGPALNKIASYSLKDKDQEFRIHCFEQMKKRKSPSVVNQYIKMLKSKDNKIVNRAAYGLGILGDKSAIGPLINALRTKHKYIIGKVSNPGRSTHTFQKNGSSGNRMGGGLSMGGKPKVYRANQRNVDVHNTLTQLTDVDFAYDKKAWKRWFSIQKKPQSIDARRD